MSQVTASLIIIGNEILSGRTQDKNISYVAVKLNDAGIQLREVRVVPDVEKEIVDAVNAVRARYDYVFTTGGIGPTHDDITSASIATAFGVKLHRHPDAEKALRAHYSADQINESRLKMADVPVGSELIPNAVSTCRAISYHVDRGWLSNTDSVGNLHKHFAAQSSSNQVFCYMTGSISSTSVHFARIFSTKCPTTMCTFTTVCINNYFTTR